MLTYNGWISKYSIIYEKLQIPLVRGTWFMRKSQVFDKFCYSLQHI